MEGAVVHHGLHPEHAHAGGFAGPVLGDMTRSEGHACFMDDDADAFRKAFAHDVEDTAFLHVVAVLHDVGDGFFHGEVDLAQAGALESELGGGFPDERLGWRQVRHFVGESQFQRGGVRSMSSGVSVTQGRSPRNHRPETWLRNQPFPVRL